MTGILPIRKYGTQSALSDFEEFTMVKPGRYAPYAGFTEEEVRKICRKTDLDFEEMTDRYDGWQTVRIPNAEARVRFMKAMRYSG